MKTVLAMFTLAVVMALQGVIASQPPESDPDKELAPGITWACNRLKSEESIAECKTKRKEFRRFSCQVESDYKYWYCLKNSECIKHPEYANKDYCVYNKRYDSGDGAAETLSCTGASFQTGSCLFSIPVQDSSDSSSEGVAWNDDNGKTLSNDTIRDLYYDSVDEICEGCTVEECKLRCHANIECRGINYDAANHVCTIIYAEVTGVSEIDIDGNSLNTTNYRCYPRNEECTGILPKSCTKEVTSGDANGACWDAGEGYKPCPDSDYCSEDECIYLCQLNPKCQGYQIATDYDSTTCLHFSLLPGIVDTMVDAHCYSVFRAHQFNSSCNTEDPLPQDVLVE